jgi:hypothetical protein
MTRRLAIALSSLALVTAAGCAPITGRAAGRAVRSTIDEVGDPRTRAQVAEFLSDPRVQEATQELTAGVAAAIAEELTSAERMERMRDAMDRATTHLAATSGHAAADAFSEHAPELVDELLRTASSEDNRARMSLMASSVTEGVVRATRAGLGEVQPRPDGVVAGMKQTAQRGLELARSIAIGLGAVAMLLVVLLVRSVLRERRARKDAQARETALALLAGVIKVAQERPWATELQSLLRSELRDDPAAESIRSFLRAHPELRMRPRAAAFTPAPA